MLLDGLAVLEQVSQGRHPRAVRVGALGRLVQLLRVAQQYQVRPGVRDGENVGQRHLGRLVHEQHVDGTAGLLARPKPGSARPYLAGAGKLREHSGVVFLQSHPVVVGIIRRIAADLPHGTDVEAPFLGGGQCRVEEIDDHLVAVGGDADARPILHQLADHPRGGKGLACAGRPLDGKDAEVPPSGDAQRGLQRCLARLTYRVPAETGRLPQQEGAGRFA